MLIHHLSWVRFSPLERRSEAAKRDSLPHASWKVLEVNYPNVGWMGSYTRLCYILYIRFLYSLVIGDHLLRAIAMYDVRLRRWYGKLYVTWLEFLYTKQNQGLHSMNHLSNKSMGVPGTSFGSIVDASCPFLHIQVRLLRCPTIVAGFLASDITKEISIVNRITLKKANPYLS